MFDYQAPLSSLLQVTTGWYKRLGDKIWTPWFIKFIHSRGYYNIYTNFLQERALSTSHRDPGVNYGKTAGPDSKLLDEGSLDFNLWELQPLRNLKWYDFCFSEVLRWRVVKSYSELGSVLGYLQKQKPIVLVSLYKTTDRTARNLICLLERLSMPNFVFVGGKTELLHDLARRGYTVIDSDQFINSIQSHKLTGEQSEISLMKEILVKANVVKRSLELGYDCWMMDGNLVPSTDFFTELPDSSYTVSASKNLELMLVKSSPSSSKIWVDDFASKIASTGTSLMASNSIPVEQRHFVYFAIEVLENTGTTKVLLFDESMIGVKIGGDDTINQKSLDSSKKFVFWSWKMTEDSVERDLKKLDMWLIDEDSSCISVVCHR